jgi:hypothetical protein
MKPRRLRIVTVAMLSVLGWNWLQAQTNGWSVPINISNTPNHSYYPAMAISRSGRIFVVWEERDHPTNQLKARIFMTTHDENGWSLPVAITDTGKMHWTPDVAVDTLGNPHVVWGEYLSGEVYYQFYNGTSWSFPKNVSESWGGSFYPRIVIDKRNNIHIVWHDNALGDYAVYYRSFDGSQWSPITILSDTLRYSGFPRIVVGAGDDLHLTWDSRMPPGDNMEVFYRSNVAGVWTPIAQLSFDTLYSIYPVVAVGQNSWPIVVWQQTVDISQYPIVQKIYWSTNDGTHWSQPMPIADRSQSLRPSIVVDKRGVVHAVWDLYTRIAQSGVDSVLYSEFQGNIWSVPLNISVFCGYHHCGNPVIAIDSIQNLHVLWIAVNDGVQARAEIYYTSCDRTVGVNDNEGIQGWTSVSLSQNYPNPFNSQTLVHYALSRKGSVVLAVFDILGREVTRLERTEEAGVHVWVFDGSTLATGVYRYSIQCEGYLLSRRMLLIR